MWFQKKKEVKTNRSFVSVRMEAMVDKGQTRPEKF